MHRQYSTIPWLLGTTMLICLGRPAGAGEYGEIIITRDVQPRAATHKEMTPDPNPKQVYGSPDAYLKGGVNSALGNELDDSDFATINSGMAITQRLLTGQPGQPNNRNSQPITSATSGIGGKTGGATGGIAGRVNHSVQQGLRPLKQVLSGQ